MAYVGGVALLRPPRRGSGSASGGGAGGTPRGRMSLRRGGMETSASRRAPNSGGTCSSRTVGVRSGRLEDAAGCARLDAGALEELAGLEDDAMFCVDARRFPARLRVDRPFDGAFRTGREPGASLCVVPDASDTASFSSPTGGRVSSGVPCGGYYNVGDSGGEKSAAGTGRDILVTRTCTCAVSWPLVPWSDDPPRIPASKENGYPRGNSSAATCPKPCG